MNKLTVTLPVLLSLLPTLVACEVDAPDEVVGSATFALRGVAMGEAPPPQLGAVWNAYDMPLAAAIVPVSGDGSYELLETAPPPAGALESTLTVIQREELLDEPRVAIAALVGLTEGADPSALEASDILLPGTIPNHFVVYVEASLPPGSFAAEVFGPLGPGYHLLEAVPGEPREVWARRGEVCTDPDDDRCSPDEHHGASGVELSVSFEPRSFESAPNFDVSAIPMML
jgi:hypothetical protein